MIVPSPQPRSFKALVVATTLTLLVALLIAPLILSIFASTISEQRVHLVHFGMYFATTVGTALLFVTLGLGITGNPLGILLSARNTYSLPRMQMALWTILVISALAAVIACRASNGVDPLMINISSELLAATGISFASAAAAPAILTLKSQTSSTDAQVAAAAGRLGESVAASGQLVGRPSTARASLADLVQGDDLSTAGTIDLSKVQQVLITLMLIAVYAGMLGSLFIDQDFVAAATKLPEFSPSFVNLLLVSHGGYLAYTAASKPTATSSAATSQRPASPDRNAGLSL